MAEEYLHAGNYQMAKRFFERIVQPYQKEGWWLVLASVQRSLLTCAIHLGQVLVANGKRPGHVCVWADMPEENGCDPWTAGESDPTGNPRDPSLVPNRPGQPFRRGSREQRGGHRFPPALA